MEAVPGGVSAAPPPDAVVDSIAQGGRALVALSGGVDSAVVAWLAFAALGGRALAVTLSGTAVGDSELEAASRTAREIGIQHRVEPTNVLESAEYRANPSNRCYFCRSVESEALLRVGRAARVEQFLDGIHLDDLGDDRPGLRAMDEAGFRHPLAEARWSKVDVRAVARAAGLSAADRPSNACLASRVRHGTPITRSMLETIEVAERFLSSLGFRRVRLRFDGVHARVEVDPDEVPRLRSAEVAARVQEELGRFGFAQVEMDPVGYRPRAGR